MSNVRQKLNNYIRWTASESALRWLIFDEAVSNLDQQTAEHFAQTVNKLKGKVTILFITHQLPKGLNVDEAVILGKENSAKPNEQQQTTAMTQSSQQTSGHSQTKGAGND